MRTHSVLSHLPLRAARWSATHPWRAIGAWFAFVAVAVALAALVPTKQTTDADYRLGESGRADAMVAAGHFPGGQVESVLVTARDGGAPAPDDVAKAASQLRSRASALAGVTGVSAAQWNAAHDAALIDVHLADSVDDPATVHQELAATLDEVLDDIANIQHEARTGSSTGRPTASGRRGSRAMERPATRANSAGRRAASG